MTYRAELSGRALKQMRGLTSPTFDRLIEAMAEVIDHPDDPLRTFPTSDPNVRRVEFGEAGLITHLISDGARLVIILDTPRAGQKFLHALPTPQHKDSGRGSGNGKRLIQHHHGIRRARSVEDSLPPRNADARASSARGGRRGRWQA